MISKKYKKGTMFREGTRPYIVVCIGEAYKDFNKGKKLKQLHRYIDDQYPYVFLRPKNGKNCFVEEECDISMFYTRVYKKRKKKK
jgi:hypothetical protein